MSDWKMASVEARFDLEDSKPCAMYDGTEFIPASITFHAYIYDGAYWETVMLLGADFGHSKTFFTSRGEDATEWPSPPSWFRDVADKIKAQVTPDEAQTVIKLQREIERLKESVEFWKRIAESNSSMHSRLQQDYILLLEQVRPSNRGLAVGGTDAT